MGAAEEAEYSCYAIQQTQSNISDPLTLRLQAVSMSVTVLLAPFWQC